MDILKRLGAIYLFLMAAVVVFLWITSPTLLIDNSPPPDFPVGEYPAWQVADKFMGFAAIPLMLLVAIVREAMLCRREQTDGAGGIAREYLEVNLSLAAAIVLTMWFYWNWLPAILPTDETSLMLLEIHLGFWGFIHPIFVLLSLSTGAFLWRCAGRKPG